MLLVSFAVPVLLSCCIPTHPSRSCQEEDSNGFNKHDKVWMHATTAKNLELLWSKDLRQLSSEKKQWHLSQLFWRGNAQWPSQRELIALSMHILPSSIMGYWRLTSVDYCSIVGLATRHSRLLHFETDLVVCMNTREEICGGDVVQSRQWQSVAARLGFADWWHKSSMVLLGRKKWYPQLIQNTWLTIVL